MFVAPHHHWLYVDVGRVRRVGPLVVAVAPTPVEVDPHLANVYLVPPRHVCIAFPAVRVVPVSFRIYVCAGLPKPDPTVSMGMIVLLLMDYN